MVGSSERKANGNMSIEERIAVLEKRVDDLSTEKQTKIKKIIGVGDVFHLAGIRWKILDITDQGYLCHAMEPWKRSQFGGSSNNWAESELRRELNELADMIVNEVGDDNIIQFERNLIALDGQTEYGVCMDRVSLLTVDEYRKYRSLLPNTDDYWWWTITPWSTARNDDSIWVSVVSPSGDINYRNCGNDYGVRPFCILSSEIFESEDT